MRRSGIARGATAGAACGARLSGRLSRTSVPRELPKSSPVSISTPTVLGVPAGASAVQRSRQARRSCAPTAGKITRRCRADGFARADRTASQGVLCFFSRKETEVRLAPNLVRLSASRGWADLLGETPPPTRRAFLQEDGFQTAARWCRAIASKCSGRRQAALQQIQKSRQFQSSYGKAKV